MCGICGIAGKKIERHAKERSIEKMNACLEHRGPDEKDSSAFKSCLLGQSRLSIIDLSSGHQPMKDNRDPLTIVFNGEIYNYKELRAELQAKGHRFSTTSDTEVILKTYAEYGEQCPRHLDGMFAFAIWDDRAQTLFLARDRFGKKPLYYAFDGDGDLLFASEIKSILAAGIRGVLDLGAIDAYLRLMYIPPWRSVYSNIIPLKPAHSGTFVVGSASRRLTTKRYWRLERSPLDIGYDEAKDTLRSMITAAVKKRLIADVEIGALLSGGVDSSLVTAIAQKLINGQTPKGTTPRKLKTFSAGFEDAINELPFAEEVATIVKTDHYSKQVKDDVAAVFKQVIAAFDEPFADSSAIPTYLISKHASEKVKVVLSGDGADELFIGYGWSWKHWNLQKHKRLQQILFGSPFASYLKNTEQFSDAERRALWKKGSLPSAEAARFMDNETLGEDFRSLSGFDQINRYDLTAYLTGDILTKVDRASMMASLEVRSPFLDHHLAEFVYNLPQKFKTDKHSGKIILKDILTEFLPDRLVHRRKQGFNAPIIQWLKRPDFKKMVYERFVENDAAVYTFLEKKGIIELITMLYEEHATAIAHKIWGLLVLEVWLRSHQDAISSPL